jgi:hypothetical protein
MWLRIIVSRSRVFFLISKRFIENITIRMFSLVFRVWSLVLIPLTLIIYCGKIIVWHLVKARTRTSLRHLFQFIRKSSLLRKCNRSFSTSWYFTINKIIKKICFLSGWELLKFLFPFIECSNMRLEILFAFILRFFSLMHLLKSL